MSYTEDLGKRAKAAELAVSSASTQLKNNALAAISKALRENVQLIIAENEKDLKAAKENGIKCFWWDCEAFAIIDRDGLSQKCPKIVSAIIEAAK